MDVLVYLDPSPRGEWALAVAAQLPPAWGGRLPLVASAEDAAADPHLLGRARARLGALPVETLTRPGPAEHAVIEDMFVTGCANVKYGDRDTEAQLRELRPVVGKTSLYVCRENAVLMGAGNRTTAIVDNKPVRTLKPNNFAHTVVEPGVHDIYVKRNPGGDSGTLTIRTLADEVSVVWVGMIGAGFGVLPVDNFTNQVKLSDA